MHDGARVPRAKRALQLDGCLHAVPDEQMGFVYESIVRGWVDDEIGSHGASVRAVPCWGVAGFSIRTVVFATGRRIPPNGQGAERLRG